MPWQVDPNHSRIGWAAQHYGISIIHGYFKKYEATLDFEGDDPTRWSAEVTIDAASIESNCEPRDHHLRTADYLEVETYPTITFKSKRVERANGGYRLIGDLTIHGVTREVALEGRFLGEATDNRGVLRRGFTASGVINRTDFGVGPAGPGASVAPEIRLQIDAEVVHRVPAPAS